MSRRALHVVNERGTEVALFLPALRERGFEVVDVVPREEPLPASLAGWDALLIGGGIVDTHQKHELPWLAHEIELAAEAIRDGVPAVGLCLGAQVLTDAAGGEVYRSEQPEIGWHEVETAPDARDDPLFAALPERFLAFQWHYYACRPGAAGHTLAANAAAAQALRLGPLAWGTQFHIEVTRAILLGWWEHGGAEHLMKLGYSRDSFEESLDRHLGAHEKLGRELARRFAAVAAERAA